jgi:adenylate kinase
MEKASKVLVVMGVSGCGKSLIGKKLAQALGVFLKMPMISTLPPTSKKCLVVLPWRMLIDGHG